MKTMEKVSIAVQSEDFLIQSLLGSAREHAALQPRFYGTAIISSRKL